jgi:8-hydroxy-5-deazaflavin:NADPH oxidoreductase
MTATSSPDIGILGTGRMGVRLALMFAQAGRQVVLGSRDRARAERITDQLGQKGIVPGSYSDAVRGPAVLPASFIRDGLFALLEDYRRDLDGKLLIDITNPFNDTYTDFITPWDTSAAEELQKRFPRSRVVGAFKNVWWEVFDQPLFDGKSSDVLVVSDDEQAKREFLALAEGTPFRYLDAGVLKNSRVVERMTLFSGELGTRYGYFPRMNWRLLGEAWKVGQNDQRGIGAMIAR